MEQFVSKSARRRREPVNVLTVLSEKQGWKPPPQTRI